MASVAEINAGFDVAVSTLRKVVETLAPDHNIPFVGNIRQIFLEKLQSSEGRAIILDEVRQILAAAEKVREQKK